MDRIAAEESARAAASADAQRYIAAHPYLGQLLHDFTTAVLATRPESVHRFARDYFAAFQRPDELLEPEADEDAEAAESMGADGADAQLEDEQRQ